MMLGMLVSAAILAATLITLLVLRRRGRDDEDRGQWSLEFALNLAVAIYLLVLAYAVVLGRDTIERTRQDVSAEAQSLVEMYWDVAAIPNSEGLRDRIRQYTSESIDMDWPLMAEGRMSPEAGDTLDSLRAELLTLRPEEAATQDRQSNALGRVAEVSQSRQVRTSDAESYLPDSMLIIMVISGGAVIILPWLQGFRPNISSVVADLTRIVTIGAGCLLVIMLSHPFSGPAPVDTAPLTDAQGQFDVIDAKTGS